MGAFVSPILAKIDVPLSIFAREYRNNELIADLVAPRVGVQNQSDKYWLFGREGQQIGGNVLRGPGSAAERILQTISTDSYSCQDHALARLITDEERGNFQAGNVEEWATRTVVNQLLLDRENRAAALFTTAANYPTGNKVTLSGTSQWNEATQVSTPVKDVMTAHLAVAKIGQKANTLILGPDVWAALKVNKQITDRVSPSKLGVVSTEDLAAIFEVDQVLIPKGVQVSAAGVASFVWGKHAVLAFIQPGASMADVTFAKSFFWTGAPGTTGGVSTEIGRLTPPSAKADELAVHMYYDLKQTSNVSAYLIENAVA